MVKNRQKGITKAYRNDKKDVDTRGYVLFLFSYAPPSNPDLDRSRFVFSLFHFCPVFLLISRES